MNVRIKYFPISEFKNYHIVTKNNELKDQEINKLDQLKENMQDLYSYYN